MIKTRLLTPDDAELYQKIRLEGLAINPEAFAETPAEQQSLSNKDLTTILTAKETFPQRFVLGAFLEEECAGLIGFSRDRRDKLKHRGSIWGTYVCPKMRGIGVGRTLIKDLLVRVKQFDGIESVLLSVGSISPEAEALYLSFGFACYGVEEKGLKLEDRTVDLKLMSLSIKSGPEG